MLSILVCHSYYLRLDQKQVQRAVFSDPKTWEQTVSVRPRAAANVKFVISQK